MKGNKQIDISFTNNFLFFNQKIKYALNSASINLEKLAD